MDSGFKEISCLTSVNPLKPGNRFTIESVSSVDSSVNMESPSQCFQSANPFASRLDPSVNSSSARHLFHSTNPLHESVNRILSIKSVE